MEAGLGAKLCSSLNRRDTLPPTPQATNVNKDCSAHFMLSTIPVKTKKYLGKACWEGFYAQFKLPAITQTMRYPVCK